MWGFCFRSRFIPKSSAKSAPRRKRGRRRSAIWSGTLSGWITSNWEWPLAEQWKFPRACQLVAGYHHQPERLADQTRFLVSIVYVADTLCCHSNHGFPLTARDQTLDDAQLTAMRIEPIAVQNH